MISSKYVISIIEAYSIKQKDLVAEWAIISGKGKHQSSVSRYIKESSTIDSLSFLKALSKLTGIGIEEIANEVIPEGSVLEKYLLENKSQEVLDLEKKIIEMEKTMNYFKNEIEKIRTTKN